MVTFKAQRKSVKSELVTDALAVKQEEDFLTGEERNVQRET